MRITKDMLVGDLLDRYPGAGELLLRLGMHCIGCPSSRGETLEDACAVHGGDCGEILRLLNERFPEEGKA